MRIVFDVDNIVNNLMDAALNLFNKENQSSYTVNDITRYWFAECLPESVANGIDAIFLRKDLWDSVKINRKAVALIARLMADGDDVYLATATHHTNFAWKVEQLQKECRISGERIIRIHDKGLLNADVLIDDSIDQLLSGNYYRIVLDYPWNRDVRDDVYGIYRILNIEDAYQVINQIKKDRENN